MNYTIDKPFPEYPNCRIDAYLLDDGKTHDAIMVCPGGGYEFCSWREARPVAERFNEEGFNTFAIFYSCNDDAKGGTPLKELCMGMKYLHENAERLHINPDRIFVMGFSAGGHLAASLATMWHTDFVRNVLGDQWEYAKPKAAVLAYPVITGGPYAHRGSIDHLCGGPSAGTKEAEFWSLEKRVDQHTVPCYIWHTVNDTCVPIQNTIALANALAKNNIPFEYHAYPDGPHGLSLCNEATFDSHPIMINPYVGNWVNEAVHFMNSLQ